MAEERTFAVTMVRAVRGLPMFEVGAYRYTGAWLPVVGDLITITSASRGAGVESDGFVAYVTRVDPTAETPIRVTEANGITIAADDDLVVAV